MVSVAPAFTVKSLHIKLPEELKVPSIMASTELVGAPLDQESLFQVVVVGALQLAV